MAWTDHDIETLKRMWSAGDTASKIAEAIGGGKSKNAIVGKADRLGLEARGNPVEQNKALHASITRKLHMRLQKLALPTGGREAIIEAFAFTETGTPEQIARALGVTPAKVAAAVAFLEENYGGVPA